MNAAVQHGATCKCQTLGPNLAAGHDKETR